MNESDFYCSGANPHTGHVSGCGTEEIVLGAAIRTATSQGRCSGEATQTQERTAPRSEPDSITHASGGVNRRGRRSVDGGLLVASRDLQILYTGGGQSNFQ